MTNSGIPSPVSIETSIQTIATAIARLRRLSQCDVQSSWRLCLQDLAPEAALNSLDWGQWPIAQLNKRRHIAWEKGKQPLWLCQQFVVPPDLEGYSLSGLNLKLALRWWAEQAQIFVNGQFVQAGDLFDCFTRIELSDSVSPGQTITVGLHLLSPDHDDGALVHSQLIFEAPRQAEESCPEPGFVADELAVLQRYLEQFAPQELPTAAAAITQLDWSALSDRDQFQQSLATLRHTLQPFSDWLKQRQIDCLGHAHLDLAWLWPVQDTWRAAERTFESVLSLQQAFPELTYTHSSPALFAWLEVHRPDLFAQIQQQVAAGSWEIAAGLWVEPELNIVSGESIARQVLYGQRYV
ncbi:MAG: alpha-mannosidase, partial [Leptolyngbyaceae cyanobacterium MO_188.B28]|nr:alpha-mannosidase [Leptolyngbyaceae cyanobacterium MO_188.B28]